MEMLIDIVNDPFDMRDLAPPSAMVKRMRLLHRRMLQGVPMPAPVPTSLPNDDAARQAQINGYVVQRLTTNYYLLLQLHPNMLRHASTEHTTLLHVHVSKYTYIVYMS